MVFFTNGMIYFIGVRRPQGSQKYDGLKCPISSFMNITLLLAKKWNFWRQGQKNCSGKHEFAMVQVQRKNDVLG